MAKIRQDIIDKITDTARIEEVIEDCLGTYGQGNRAGLKKAGVRYKALCPFHADRTLGSFVVYPAKNCYVCFSCGAKGGPVDFLMNHEHLSYPDAIRWLGKKYNIDVDNVPVDWTYTPRPAPPPLEMLTLPIQMVTNTEHLDGDALVNWIRTGIKWDCVQRHRIDEMLTAYYVGHGKNGHTIFWNIDENGKVRTGKMMKYKADGHRDRESDWNFDWIHAALARGIPQRDEHGYIMRDSDGDIIYDTTKYRHIFDEDKQEAQLTFFGMHLLDVYPKATIKLVESEKTALLMSIAYGNHAKQVWMACGGLSLLSRERLKPIIDRGRQVILYPDRDGITKWKQKVEQMHYDRLTIDTDPVTKWWQPEDGEKADIADVVVRYINNSKQMADINEVTDKIPVIKPLIDKLTLEVEKQ